MTRRWSSPTLGIVGFVVHRSTDVYKKLGTVVAKTVRTILSQSYLSTLQTRLREHKDVKRRLIPRS